MAHIFRFFAGAMALFAGASLQAALEPFRLPWNDASNNVTNLQGWQPTPAGAEGWVNVTADGHYQVNARPIRFLGVNITAADCFPTQLRADAHAARLARFGFNAVRFHHMEAPWDKSNVLVNYPAGNSRSLSAERLDRLHYFVARLAERGIYTNINLLVSREFQATDGLGPEITQLAGKDQHILGFFLDDALALHREYATQLLAAPNPYRSGRALAADPAVAFVEIMNENGLLHKWYENVLDTLPAPYSAALEAKWNAWLKTKYSSTTALLDGWGSINEPFGPNRLTNGDFASGTNPWFLEQHTTAVATAAAGNEFDGQPSLRIDVTTTGSAGWHVQLTQGGMSLEAGRTYTVSFAARAAAATPISATLTRTGQPDYGAVGPSIGATLGTTWQLYTRTFEAGTTESSVRIAFNGFGDRLATVWLADVKVREGGQIGGLPEGTTLEAGNIPTVKHNTSPGATAGQTRDWIAYVFAAEKNYWEAMESHIKNTLGYRGMVWATIISNSPPNTQSGMDAIDSHSYWHHPVFPVGRDFNPVDWTVANTSMVNAPAASTLGGLARQRVAGMPHNVTEYQHSSPNTYASEGPLLAAAYGALQDWDSLWMFDYSTSEGEFVNDHFDHGTHAGKMVNNLIAAALFRRGDVLRADTVHTMAFSPSTEIELARTRGGAWSIANGSHLDVPATLTFQNRLALDVGEDATGLTEPPPEPSGSVIVSDTQQLRWDTSVANKGVVTVDAPRSKAVIGFVAGRTFALGGVTIAPGATRQDWCTIGLSLLRGHTLTHATGGSGVIVATGDQENTNQVWKDASHTSVGADWGTSPVLVEVIPATITLPVAATRVSVWALDGTGHRMQSVAVRDAAGQAQFDLGQSGATLWYEFEITPEAVAPPLLLVPPRHVTTTPGDAVVLRFDAMPDPNLAVQWRRHGTPVANAGVLMLAGFVPMFSGVYDAVLTNSAGSITTEPIIVGLTSLEKVIGTGRELTPANIVHSNGNVFDQVLVTGAAESITADHALNQITRTSFVDLDHDIVQVEFSGPGTLTLLLEVHSGPARPVNYHQDVDYVQGHAGIVITGATEKTNVTVFTVGRETALNQSLFKDDVTYGGIADLAFIAISSLNGKFGGVRTANANYYAAQGVTGIFAPGVNFLGPVYLGDVSAFDSATPMIRLGSASDVRITGGPLRQENAQPVHVSGFTQLRFTAGSDSHGNIFPAQTNQATLVENGEDVTARIVVNPSP